MNLKFTEFKLKNDKVLNKINFNLFLIQDLDYYIDNIEDNIYWSTVNKDLNEYLYLYIGNKDEENYFLKCRYYCNTGLYNNKYFNLIGLNDMTIEVSDCKIIKDNNFAYLKVFENKSEIVTYF